MLKIIVLEDENAQLAILKKYLHLYSQNNPSFEYSLTAYERGVLLLTDYCRDADLIFLDIRVPDMPGIDVARKIREIDDKVMIIFVTSLEQYAIDGYSVNAFDYILKPLQYSSFSAKLKRALNVLSYREPSLMLDLRTKEGGRRVSADCITYVESSGHDILFHAGDETIKQWGTLTKYETILKDARFVRCNTSFLVNLKYVKGIRKDLVDVSGELLPISRSRRKDFLAALAQYKGGSL